MTPTPHEPPHWHEPGRVGRMKPTPLFPHQAGFVPPNLTQDDEVDSIYELFALDAISENQLNQLIAKCYADPNPAPGH